MSDQVYEKTQTKEQKFRGRNYLDILYYHPGEIRTERHDLETGDLIFEHVINGIHADFRQFPHLQQGSLDKTLEGFNRLANLRMPKNYIVFRLLN
jgi:hypothetical protein